MTYYNLLHYIIILSYAMLRYKRCVSCGIQGGETMKA